MTEAQQIRLDPDPLEPYLLSQGFRLGELVIVSGQAALDEQGSVVGAGDFDAQAEQVFRNLARVLEAGGSSTWTRSSCSTRRDRVGQPALSAATAIASISSSSSGNASEVTSTIVSAG